MLNREKRSGHRIAICLAVYEIHRVKYLMLDLEITTFFYK